MLACKMHFDYEVADRSADWCNDILTQWFSQGKSKNNVYSFSAEFTKRICCSKLSFSSLNNSQNCAISVDFAVTSSKGKSAETETETVCSQASAAYFGR